jgi:hypothetical protein
VEGKERDVEWVHRVADDALGGDLLRGVWSTSRARAVIEEEAGPLPLEELSAMVRRQREEGVKWAFDDRPHPFDIDDPTSPAVIAVSIARDRNERIAFPVYEIDELEELFGDASDEQLEGVVFGFIPLSEHSALGLPYRAPAVRNRTPELLALYPMVDDSAATVTSVIEVAFDVSGAATGAATVTELPCTPASSGAPQCMRAPGVDCDCTPYAGRDGQGSPILTCACPP